MPEDLEAIKREIADLIRRGKHQVGIWPGDPIRWWPGNVTDPRTKCPFTHAGCWDFIAEELGKKYTVVKEKILRKPIGKIGYEFCVTTEHHEIYIKLRLSNGVVIGRSFHISVKGEDNE